MSVKKTIAILAAAAMLAGAAPAFADNDAGWTPFRHHLSARAAAEPGSTGNSRNGLLTLSELNTIANFESEVNYRNFVSQLSAKYGVSPAAIERMADRQLAAEKRRFYRSAR